MDAQPSDAKVHLRLRCPDAEDFVERFAPNVTRGGIFLPTHDAREVGAAIRFEVALADDTVVLAGDGVVTWCKPKGLGVKFTTLDPAAEAMLERLLSRREASAAAPTPARERPAGEQASPTPAPERPSSGAQRAAPTPALPSESSVETRWWGRTPPVRLAAATPPAVPASEMTGLSTRSFAQLTRRPQVRVALVCAAVFVGVAVIWLSVGRARSGTSSSPEPAKPRVAATAAASVAAPAVDESVPPVRSSAPPGATLASQKTTAELSPPAPEPPTESPPTPRPTRTAPTERPTGGRSGGLRVEKLVTGASYKNFTCPSPTTRFSARSTRTVNVCLHVAHKPGATEHLTLVWEKNGGFAGKTLVEIPSSRSTVRTRAHMKIGANRVGSWSVRAVSDRNASLAETTFDVVP
jgi:Tfp pilus assembly protein PilZ